MSNAKSIRTVTVVNPEGLHIRAAMALAKAAMRYRAHVELVKGDNRVDADAVLQLMTLAAVPGDQLILEAGGEDADAALDALVRLFENNFESE